MMAKKATQNKDQILHQEDEIKDPNPKTHQDSPQDFLSNFNWHNYEELNESGVSSAFAG